LARALSSLRQPRIMDRWLDRATGFFFLAGIIRIAALVLHRPMFGYANNFDFYRLAQWYGITSEPGERLAPHPDAPLVRYLIGERRVPEDAYLSSELVFLVPSVWLQRAARALGGISGAEFDIRWLGAIRAVALVAGACIAILVLRNRSRYWALAAAATFAFVLADPTLTLYLNSLYCEFSIALFAFSSIVCLVWLRGTGTWTATSVATTALALAGLGLAKMQTMWAPLVLVIITGVFLFCDNRLSRQRVPALLALAGASIVPPVVHQTMASGGLYAAIREANVTDTWFGAVLPALHDPAAAIRELRLPPRCAAYVGKTWYDPGMQPLQCPELAQRSRAWALFFLLREPRAAMTIGAQAAEASRPWLVQGYGQVEGRAGGKLADEALFASRSLLAVVELARPSQYRRLLVLALAALPLAVLRAVWTRVHGGPGTAGALGLVTALSSALVAYSFGSSLFGDGLVSFSQHVNLGQLAFFPALVFGLLYLSVAFGASSERPEVDRPRTSETP
jgi:hypothetical protein